MGIVVYIKRKIDIDYKTLENIKIYEINVKKKINFIKQDKIM